VDSTLDGAIEARPDLVRAEQVRVLYAKAGVSLLTVLVNSTIVSYVFAGAVSRVAIGTWVGGLYAITFARFVLRQRYLVATAAPSVQGAGAWETYFAIGAAVNGVAWGAATLLLYPPGGIALQVFLAFVLAGMTAGATASTSTSFRAFAAFTVPALAPITLRFLSEGDRLHVAMGGMTALFGFAMSAIAKSSGENFRDSARLRFENGGLVTDLKRAQVGLTELNLALEKRVEDRTNALNAILDHAPVMLALYDKEGQVELVNRELEQRLGWTLQDFKRDGEPIDRCAEPGTRAELRAHLLGDDTSWKDFHVVARDGRSLFTSWANARLANGRIIGIGQDITERQHIQEGLALSERMASLGTLAAGVAHEMNNPLSFVLGNLEFVASSLRGVVDSWLKEGTGVPQDRVAQLREAVEALKEAHDGARRVANIVVDLRMFSRGSDDRSVAIDLVPVLEASTRIVANELVQRASLVRELGEVPAVRGMEGRLGHVFVSLLINAAQSIDGDPANNEIRVVSKTGSDGSAVVEFHDTGCGIHEDLLQRIFDPFFTTKPVGQATGLGLSVCKGIVSALGGRLEVESRVGAGSIFRVILPAASKELESPLSTPAPRRKIERARILIIDDEPMFVKALRRMLRDAYDVVEETVASRAIARVAAGETFDLILCDLMMPGITGVELYHQVLRLAPQLAARIVFMTGGAFTEKSAEFLERSRNLRLSKPFGQEELARVLETMLGGPS
jgi:PAS domain S-box-containing protein